MKLDIEPFKIGETEVSEVEVKALRFVEFVKVMSGAGSAKEQQRKRMRASVLLDGEPLTSEQIPLLPIAVSKKIMAALNDDAQNGPRGEVVTPEADGIDTPILYRLGTPLRMKRGKDEVVVEELEFHAKQFGDVEDIIAATSRMGQALEMLKRIATPVGVKGLTILPEALINQIMPTDGRAMAENG